MIQRTIIDLSIEYSCATDPSTENIIWGKVLFSYNNIEDDIKREFYYSFNFIDKSYKKKLLEKFDAIMDVFDKKMGECNEQLRKIEAGYKNITKNIDTIKSPYTNNELKGRMISFISTRKKI